MKVARICDVYNLMSIYKHNIVLISINAQPKKEKDMYIYIWFIYIHVLIEIYKVSDKFLTMIIALKYNL